jgi:hypothetical protein
VRSGSAVGVDSAAAAEPGVRRASGAGPGFAGRMECEAGASSGRRGSWPPAVVGALSELRVMSWREAPRAEFARMLRRSGCAAAVVPALSAVLGVPSGWGAGVVTVAGVVPVSPSGWEAEVGPVAGAAPGVRTGRGAGAAWDVGAGLGVRPGAGFGAGSSGGAGRDVWPGRGGRAGYEPCCAGREGWICGAGPAALSCAGFA